MNEKTSRLLRRFAKNNIAVLDDPLLKAIYLRRRFELQDDMGLEYNLLASIFKGRDIPTMKSGGDSRDMTAQEKTQAVQSIRTQFPGFDYDALVAVVKNAEAIKAKFHATAVGYEKIQLFRIFNDDLSDDVIRKFINESYHIENEYVMQLNPHKFESFPEYVIEECLRLLPG